MNGRLEFCYRGRNGHHYFKHPISAEEIRRIYKRVKPVSFDVWYHSAEGYATYSYYKGYNCLQARSTTYMACAERYNGVTEIYFGGRREFTSC